MEKVFVGKIINTHGIKGELKISTDFKYMEDVFIVGNTLYILDKSFVISSVRVHKGCKLVCFEGYSDINDVLMFKGKDCYIDRNILSSDCILNSDIIGFDVIVGNRNIGVLDSIIKNSVHEILVVGKTMIPYVDFFVKEIDFDKNCIYVNEVEGLVK